MGMFLLSLVKASERLNIKQFTSLAMAKLPSIKQQNKCGYWQLFSNNNQDFIGR